MSSLSLIVLLLVNFVAIGLLPVLFFRSDGNFNLRWIATGAPFFIAPVGLLLGYAGILEASFTIPGEAIATVIATMLAAASIALIAMTVGTHRIPLALWHQQSDADAPAEIVTWGPYRRVRHPFYTSFLLAFLAAAIAFPHLLTIGCFVYSLVALSITAAGEEARLSESEFGDEYKKYMSVSGRFLPR